MRDAACPRSTRGGAGRVPLTGAAWVQEEGMSITLEIDDTGDLGADPSNDYRSFGPETIYITGRLRAGVYPVCSIATVNRGSVQ